MRKINFNFFSTCFFIAILAGCGGKTAKSLNEVVTVTVDAQQVVGYWTPANSANHSYEFFSSPTETPYNIPLKTGRILQGANLVSPFYWDMQSDGTIVLSLLSPSCPNRPLNNCPVIAVEKVIASGSSIQNSAWTISVDDNNDGVVDKKVTDTYHRQEIELSNFPQGDFFLIHDNNQVFDTPISGSVGSGKMSIRLDDFDKPITVSTDSFNTKAKSVKFSSSESSAILVDQSLYVSGTGYKKFTIKKWFEKVALSASSNGGFSLSYELHRKVQVPSDIDPALILIDQGSSRYQIRDYEMVEHISSLFGVVNKFVSGIPVHALDQFYVSLELDFQKSNAGNKLIFTSNKVGELSNTLAHHPEIVSEVRNFNWVQRDDGSIVLGFPNYGDVILRFIKTISGGYQVLYSKPDENYGTTFRVRDFIRGGAPVLNEQSIPGRYSFISSGALANGSHEYNLTFHRNKTVSGVVGGYWFQDTNGDIVSFECTDLLGQSISVYATCAAALDNTSSVTFAHVRRLKFVDKDGRNFQAIYNASVYGTRTFLVYPASGDPVVASKFFTAAGASADSLALTYRWVRVGDE